VAIVPLAPSQPPPPALEAVVAGGDAGPLPIDGAPLLELFRASALPALRDGRPEQALSGWVLACAAIPDAPGHAEGRALVTAALMATTGQVARARLAASVAGSRITDGGWLDGLHAALVGLEDDAPRDAWLARLLHLDDALSDGASDAPMTETR
jgi:hypothetical protein